jgi:hypothetical protein
MRPRRSAVILLAIQLLLVLSVAGNYLYERKVCPRVWMRAAQFDPNMTLRGRYLALQLLVNACVLPRDQKYYVPGYNYRDSRSVRPGYWKWNVTLALENGHLVPRLQDRPLNQNDIYQLWLQKDKPCDEVPLQANEDYFIPEWAKGPFPLKKGQELWVEITVPPSGPPRPIQLALSTGNGFQPLKFE